MLIVWLKLIDDRLFIINLPLLRECRRKVCLDVGPLHILHQRQPYLHIVFGNSITEAKPFFNCAHVGNTKNFCDIRIPIVDISPPIDVLVEKSKCTDGLMVPCDNLLLHATEESLELIGWHIQCSNMAISDAPVQGFHRLEVSNRHKNIGTYLING